MVYKLYNGIVPLTTWLIITFPLWMSFFRPALVAYFIIAFNLYFFYKSFNTGYLAGVSFLKIEKINKINFYKKIKNYKKINEIKHFVFIPNYKEPLHKLEKTIDCIIDNNYHKTNLYLVLAFEKREKEIIKKGNFLKKKYGKNFAQIFTTYHPLKETEAAGKASNQTYAAKIIDQYLEKNGWDRKKILITICDADSLLPKNYFAYLTYKFINDKNNLYHFYWAPVLLYNNFWQLPIFVRMQATLSSVVRLAFLSSGENLIQISTYSTNFWLLKQINFWDVDIIPEDWHIYLQAFFKFGDKIKTIPLFTIINSDAVYSGKLLKTLVNRYEQEKRWAWGVSDVGYSLKRLFETPHINFFTKLKKIIFLAENHLLWPISFFILTLSASIPPLVNPVFKRTVLGFLLPKTSAFILTLATLVLIFYIILDINLRKKVNKKTPVGALPILIIQWYILPVVSFFLSSLPALQAHTQILLGKKLKYKVTEKV